MDVAVQRDRVAYPEESEHYLAEEILRTLNFEQLEIRREHFPNSA